MRHIVSPIIILLVTTLATPLAAQRLALEVEGGAVWQSRNQVQIPNDASGSRFSLQRITGSGPWPTGRLYATWHADAAGRHGIRLLVAPLSITERGTIDGPVDFAGARYVSGQPLDATYTFNSYRVTYRYRWRSDSTVRSWIGFTAKLRDARIAIAQGSVASEKENRGFVPLLHAAAEWSLAHRWRAVADVDALAGGPGRAIDASVKVGREVGQRVGVYAGYRTVEGGADVDDVYNFAWLHYAVASVVWRW